MSEPTEGERQFASRHQLEPDVLSRARDILNIIVSQPWPRTEQVSALARLARTAHADVGVVLAGLALARAPVAEFHALMDVKGLADKRVVGLARALAKADVTALPPDASALRNALDRISALTAENRELRAEVDRMRVAMDRQAGPGASPSSTMRLQDVASSAGEQIVAADQDLRAMPKGVRLSRVELRLLGAASQVGQDLALDIGAPDGGSAVGLQFASGSVPDTVAESLPLIDVRGYGLALARRKLSVQGFAVAVASIPSDGVTRGVVTEQVPAPGTLVPAGAMVRLVVS